MRKIAVYVGFMNDDRRARMDAAASALGFTVDYYDSNTPVEPDYSAYEVIFGHADPKLLKKAAKLQWLCSDFAGVEKYLDDSVWPYPDCLLSNSSGAYGPAIAEHVVMVLLMLLRRMPEYQTELARREWTVHMPIRSITGSRVVVLGTGDVGSHIARRLRALGAVITGVSRSGRAKEAEFDQVLPMPRLEEVLPQADALVLALPATAETAGLLSRQRIALLPPQALVVNVGRGSTVDQDALVDALRSRSISGAALDVMTPEPLPRDHPLWSCPNTILTPHISGNMALDLTCDTALELFLSDLERYAAGEPLQGLVDRRRGY